MNRVLPVVTERLTKAYSSRVSLVSSLALPRTDLLREVGLDLLLVCVSYAGAHLLRFGGELPPLMHAASVLPAIGLLKVAVFAQFQLYRTVWTHAGTPDAVRLVQASTAVSAALLLGATIFPAAGAAPIALLVIDWLLATVATGGWRFARRSLNRHVDASGSDRTRILIYGADACGLLLFRHLRRVLPAHTSIVGFVDPGQNGLQLRGLPVVDRPAAMGADTLIVPVPSSAAVGTPVRNLDQITASYASTKVSCYSVEPTISSPLPAPLQQEQRPPSRPIVSY